MNPLTSLTSAHQAHLRRKVNAVIGSLQILACTNTVWVFCLTALPLRDRPGFLERLGQEARSMKNRLLSFLFVLFSCFLLAACGGGGGGVDVSSNNQPKSSGFALAPLKTRDFSGVQKDLAYTKDPFQALTYHTTFISCPPDNVGCAESTNFYQKVVNTTMEGEKVSFGDSGKFLELDPTRYGLSKDFSGCTYSNTAGQLFIPLFPDIPSSKGMTSPLPELPFQESCRLVAKARKRLF